LFAAAFFPSSGTDIVFALYITGITLAVFTGLLLKKTVYKGTVSPFIMELSQYRMPSVKNAVINALFRLQAFIKKSGKILVPIIAILGIMNSAGALEAVGKTVSPVFKPIGIDEENWPASVALFSGLFAKEVIAGSLNSLYSQNENTPRPSGTPLEEGNEENESLFKNMRNAFHNSKAAVFAFLLFVLLYVPCVAAVSTAVKEAGKALVALQVSYSTVLGWCLATIFYQSLEGGSIFYIGLAAAILVSFVSFVLWYARFSGRFEE
jgi:ferrous iron transport protein B